MSDPEMLAAIRARVRAFGDTQTLEAFDGALDAYAPLHEREPYRDVTVTRDVAYGDHARQRLDVFTAAATGGALRPVMLFVHGGAFVRGDKRMSDRPYYDNVGLWAARHGFTGITMNYRLAPDHVWPSGADDVAAALGWIAASAAAYGGDPAAVFAIGHSAGAAHLASAIARRDAGVTAPFALRGAILISGIYDLSIAEPAPGTLAYYGADAAARRARSSLAGITATPTPLLIVNAQYDAEDFHAQERALVAALGSDAHKRAAFVLLDGHGHLSEVAHLNADDDVLSRAVLAFTERLA
jgi:acetyl esterase/lipase